MTQPILPPISALISPNPWTDQDHLAMQRAIVLADRAAALGEVPVGAVVMLGDKIIGEGYNQSIQRHDPSAHAEIMALRQAARHIGNYRLIETTLYVTLEPCMMCAGAMQHARVARIVFGTPDPKTGACGSIFDAFADTRLNHHATATGGLLADLCAQQLRDFFAARRLAAKAKNTATPPPIST